MGGKQKRPNLWYGNNTAKVILKTRPNVIVSMLEYKSFPSVYIYFARLKVLTN